MGVELAANKVQQLNCHMLHFVVFGRDRFLRNEAHGPVTGVIIFMYKEHQNGWKLAQRYKGVCF